MATPSAFPEDTLQRSGLLVFRDPLKPWRFVRETNATTETKQRVHQRDPLDTLRMANGVRTRNWSTPVLTHKGDVVQFQLVIEQLFQ